MTDESLMGKAIDLALGLDAESLGSYVDAKRAANPSLDARALARKLVTSYSSRAALEGFLTGLPANPFIAIPGAIGDVGCGQGEPHAGEASKRAGEFSKVASGAVQQATEFAWRTAQDAREAIRDAAEDARARVTQVIERRSEVQSCLLANAGMSRDTSLQMQRVLRIASSFEEADRLDRDDLSRLSLEERINAVTELRKVWFRESRIRSGLVRVLETTDAASRALRPDRRPRRSGSR